MELREAVQRLVEPRSRCRLLLASLPLRPRLPWCSPLHPVLPHLALQWTLPLTLPFRGGGRGESALARQKREELAVRELGDREQEHELLAQHRVLRSVEPCATIMLHTVNGNVFVRA